MKKLLAVLLLFPPLAFAGSLSLDPNQCSALAISTSPVTPTQIFAADAQATKTYVLNVSTNPVYIVGFSTTSVLGITTNAAFSISLSTGSFYLPAVAANVQPIAFELDGPDTPFTGPLWGVSASNGLTMTILRCRTH